MSVCGFGWGRGRRGGNIWQRCWSRGTNAFSLVNLAFASPPSKFDVQSQPKLKPRRFGVRGSSLETAILTPEPNPARVIIKSPRIRMHMCKCACESFTCGHPDVSRRIGIAVYTSRKYPRPPNTTANTFRHKSGKNTLHESKMFTLKFRFSTRSNLHIHSAEVGSPPPPSLCFPAPIHLPPL